MQYGRDTAAGLVNQARTEVSRCNQVPKAVGREGSLALAFSMLHSEVEMLEGSFKRLYDRVEPALDAAPPETGEKELAPAKGAPLANAVFEYVERIQRVRVSLNELYDRIAF